ncbi:MAG TPA: 50S ribosomal protein L25 [Candidatus Paceibacterota bacterium]|nr:50S ribosomal protein L25 [Candidatus Paceibacterota bacterium]
MLTLTATKRTNENPATLRTQEQIPAVYYGAHTVATAIAVPLRAFLKTWKEAGETTMVALDFGTEKVNTLIHAMQYDPITSTPIHIDFLVVDVHKAIEVTVPIEFTGLAEAEKAGLGTLVKVLHEVTVKALPNDLPHKFEVEVTALATLDAQLHVKDLVLPKGVTMITDPEEVVALIAPFKEEVEEAAPAMDLESIEVEKKGKKDEDEQEPAV